MKLIRKQEKLVLLWALVCHHSIFIFCDAVKLGDHTKEDRGLYLIGKFSTPGVFYEHFVKPGVPLIMKSVLDEPKNKFPAYNYWYDDYMRENFGDEVFNVEKQKKENRKMNAEQMKLGDFLDKYKLKSIYLVSSASQKMRDDLALPLTLQCGGFEKSLHDAVVWFSSGGTSSVLHRDLLNNLMCVLEGSKDFIFIDKKYKKEVESVGFIQEGSYSSIDVENVDKKKFSQLLSLPWLKAHVNEGDCIFIPYGWYHQIRSNGLRNLAVNYWFSHRWWFNHPDCINFEKFKPTEPLNNYSMVSSNEVIRFQMLQPYKDLEIITKTQFLEPNVDKDERLKLFDFINLDRDSNLTWEELYHFDIDEAVKNFQKVLALDFIREIEEVKVQNTDVNSSDVNSSDPDKFHGKTIKDTNFVENTTKSDAKLKSKTDNKQKPKDEL